MTLAEQLPEGGTGVIATASGAGVPNAAIYARPHVIDDETLAWGLTDSRTHANLRENPRAAFLWVAPGRGFAGCRLALELLRFEESGPLLEEIRANTARLVSPAAAAAVKHVGYFRVVEIRPLI